MGYNKNLEKTLEHVNQSCNKLSTKISKNKNSALQKPGSTTNVIFNFAFTKEM